jgi:hypothetical protein
MMRVTCVDATGHDEAQWTAIPVHKRADVLFSSRAPAQEKNILKHGLAGEA